MWATFFNQAAFNVYTVFCILYINVYFSFINTRAVLYFIRVKKKGFIEIVSLVGAGADLVSCAFGMFGIISNKEELAALFTGIAMLVVLRC